MSKEERDERIRKHLEAEVWPTEDEMKAFVEECERNPHTYEDLIAELEVMAQPKASK
jgi:hypothetical protein